MKAIGGSLSRIIFMKSGDIITVKPKINKFYAEKQKEYFLAGIYGEF